MRVPGLHPRVVDKQQHAAGRDGCEQCPLGCGVGRAQQGRVLRGDQVERRRRELRLRQFGVHPANGDSGVPRVSGRPLQRHPGDLQRGHLPAAAREPDGVGALAAADVEHPPRREPGDLGHERAVGPAAPQLLPVGVPAVPLRAHCGVSEVSVAGRGGVGGGRLYCDVVGHGPTVTHRGPMTPLLLPVRQNGVRLGRGCSTGRGSNWTPWVDRSIPSGTYGAAPAPTTTAPATGCGSAAPTRPRAARTAARSGAGTSPAPPGTDRPSAHRAHLRAHRRTRRWARVPSDRPAWQDEDVGAGRAPQVQPLSPPRRCRTRPQAAYSPARPTSATEAERPAPRVEQPQRLTARSG